MDSNAFFVSDAHLGIDLPGYNQREPVLIDFLRSIRTQATHLFIVGDLFDFWIEYQHAIRPVYFNILRVLADLVDTGVKVHYLAGNHDFALGSFLSDTIGITIHPESCETELGGKKVFLFHGDGIIRQDIGYRLLKKILRNKTNQKLYRLLHPNCAVPFASFFSGSSRKMLRHRLTEAIAQEYREKGRQILVQGGYDFVVFGHTHRPELISFSEGVYCNSGEWIRRYTWLQLQNGIMMLWELKDGVPTLLKSSGELDKSQ
jgi:UDP-2,3-diacylglucosamine hydrolase